MSFCAGTMSLFKGPLLDIPRRITKPLSSHFKLATPMNAPAANASKTQSHKETEKNTFENAENTK